MAYATVEQFRQYLDISAQEDDALLSRLLDAATSYIDNYTGRHFTSTTGSRTYRFAMCELLPLDDDILSVTSASDGSGSVSTSILWYTPPARMIVRMDRNWDISNGVVTITGTWGYSATPPDVIIQACLRIAAWMYRQKDAQVFDVTGQTGYSQVSVGKGVPPDVLDILNVFRVRSVI